MSPPSRPTLELPIAGATRRHEGLGRLLGLLSLLCFLGPVVASVVAAMIGKLAGVQALSSLADALVRISGHGGIAALPVAILSVLATSSPIPLVVAARALADRSGLRLRGERLEASIPRHDILSGLVVPEVRRVRLTLRGGRLVDVEVRSEQDGVRLLAALGFGPEQRRVAVTLGSPNRQLAAGCLGLPLATVFWLLLAKTLVLKAQAGPWLGVPIVLLIVLSGWFLRRLARPIQVVVGSDGVRIERPFLSVWLPHAELAGLQSIGDRLRLVRAGGGPPEELVAPGGIADALAQRIRAAHRQTTYAEGAPRGADALDRRGRDLAAWREDLRRLLVPADYRAPAFTPEDAIHALEDPQAPRERRIGAALALRIADHPDARERIRVAAETSADDELRAALEHAAEGEVDEASLERALLRVPRA